MNCQRNELPLFVLSSFGDPTLTKVGEFDRIAGAGGRRTRRLVELADERQSRGPGDGETGRAWAGVHL
jgi:hypothetical protein